MTEQPAARAAPTLRDMVWAGTFHAAKAATGPTGSAVTIHSRPTSRAGMIRP